MVFFDFATAIFTGNALTLCFLWGVRKFGEAENMSDADWLAYAAFLMPLGLAAMSAISAQYGADGIIAGQ